MIKMSSSDIIKELKQGLPTDIPLKDNGVPTNISVPWSFDLFYNLDMGNVDISTPANGDPPANGGPLPMFVPLFY